MWAHLKGLILLGTHLEGVTNLTSEQFSKTKSLAGAIIEPTLLDELKQKFPKDFERVMKDPNK